MKTEHARFKEITKARITPTRELVISYDKRTNGFAFGELAEITEGGQHRKHFVGRNVLVSGISELQNIQNALAIVIHDAEERALKEASPEAPEDKRYTAEEVKAMIQNMIGGAAVEVSDPTIVFKNYGEELKDEEGFALAEALPDYDNGYIKDEMPIENNQIEGQLSIEDVVPEEVKETEEKHTAMDARELNELKIAMRRGWITQEKYDNIISGKEELQPAEQLTLEEFEDEEW